MRRTSKPSLIGKSVIAHSSALGGVGGSGGTQTARPAENGCSAFPANLSTHREHYHCPLECEHPQPIVCDDGRRLCGRCWFVDDVRTEMVLCTPETCD